MGSCNYRCAIACYKRQLNEDEDIKSGGQNKFCPPLFVIILMLKKVGCAVRTLQTIKICSTNY